jgi:CubicO group peptidase (beta-lactamase class C family)
LTLADALTAIDSWPGRDRAVAVVDGGGTRVSRGAVERRLPLASVSKPLVAYAVLVAIEEGSLGLDRPLDAGTSVRHLLAHASGFAPDEPTLLAAPATRRIYSNAGFEALGEVLEAATGFSTTTYLREAVLDPLSMSDTALEGSPASGVVSTASDMARFGVELLEPTLVDRATLARATSVQFAGLDGVLPGFGPQAPNDWGLGVEIRDGKQPHWTGTRNSPRTFGHFGRTGTFLWADPDARLACVCLTDAGFGPWALAAWPALSDAVLEAAAR